MNEKIDALVKKATIRIHNPILNSDGKIVVDDWEEGVSISMLAEFIVRECMDVCYRTDTEYEGHKVKSTVIASKLSEHFGVKE
jgi:hypothetical protein